MGAMPGLPRYCRGTGGSEGNGYFSGAKALHGLGGHSLSLLEKTERLGRALFSQDTSDMRIKSKPIGPKSN